jgi:hypothetical protein
LDYPVPRSAGLDDNGFSQVSPCGGYAKTNSPTILRAGDELVIKAHVNPHVDQYRVSLSPDDAHFEQNVIGTFTAKADSNFHITIPVTLPNKECIGCTLQVEMWGADWFACADVDVYTGTPPDAGPRPPPPPPIADAGSKPPVTKPAARDAGHTPTEPSEVPGRGDASATLADSPGSVSGVACACAHGKSTSAPVAAALALGLVCLRRRRSR